MKIAIISAILSSCICLPIAHADQFSWQPQINDGYTAKAGSPFAIAGKAHIDAYNDSDQPHTYRYMMGIGSDCGANINGTGIYSADITIQPHEHFIEDRAVSGYTKCNYAGNRKVILSSGFANNTGSVWFQQQYGFVSVR